MLNEAPYIQTNTILYDSVLNIPSSPFLTSSDYQKFDEFRKLRKKIKNHIREKKQLKNEEEIIEKFISSNPEYYQGWILAGDYYSTHNNNQKALMYYKKALTKEFENISVKKEVKAKVTDIENEI